MSWPYASIQEELDEWAWGECGEAHARRQESLREARIEAEAEADYQAERAEEAAKAFPILYLANVLYHVFPRVARGVGALVASLGEDAVPF